MSLIADDARFYGHHFGARTEAPARKASPPPSYGALSAGRVRDPDSVDAEKIGQTLEVVVVMENVKAGVLRSYRDGQIGQWQSVTAVGSLRGEVAHHGQHAALHGTIDWDLAKTLQAAVDYGDRLAPARVDHQLVTHGPAPRDIPSLDRCQEQLPGPWVPTRGNPRGGIGQYEALAAPKRDAHRLASAGALRRSIASRSRSKPPSSMRPNIASAAARRSSRASS